MKKKKKILFVLPALGIGGAEKSLIDLFNVFDYSMFDVSLLLLVNHGAFYSMVNPNVRIIDADIETQYLLKNIGESLPYYLKRLRLDICFWKIYASIHKRLPKAVKGMMPSCGWQRLSNKVPAHSGEYDIAVGYLQGLAEYYVIDKVTAKKKVFWMHTSFRAHANNDTFEKRYIDMFNKVVCVSQAAKEDFIQLFTEKETDTTVFYNIVDEDAIIHKSQEPLEDVEIDPSKMNIVSVGRLHEAKAYDVAIPAFKKVNEKYPDTRFYIVGTGPEESNLKSLIKKYELGGKCILLGRRMNPYNIIKACNIFLQSSRYEGYCIALAEAKILQKPIVTTDFYGAFEQIVNEENGLIVKCDEREIEHALCRLIGSPQLCQQLVGNLGSAYKRDYQTEFENIIN